MKRIAGVFTAAADGEIMELGRGTARWRIQQSESTVVQSPDGSQGGYSEDRQDNMLEVEVIATNRRHIVDTFTGKNFDSIVFVCSDDRQTKVILKQTRCVNAVEVDETTGMVGLTFRSIYKNGQVK
jgi:hypothetical protein